MNKAELIEAIVTGADGTVTKKQAETVLNATIDAITTAVSKGDTVSLVGFGTFSKAKRAERTMKNIQTGKKLVVPAKEVPKFKAGKGFKDKVAEGAKKSVKKK